MEQIKKQQKNRVFQWKWELWIVHRFFIEKMNSAIHLKYEKDKIISLFNDFLSFHIVEQRWNAQKGSSNEKKEE